MTTYGDSNWNQIHVNARQTIYLKHSYSKWINVMCKFVNVTTKYTYLGKRRNAVASEVTY